MKQHSIKGRIVDVNFAIDKGCSEIQPEVLDKFERRVFVGNLNPNTTEQQLRMYFSQFGAVLKGYLIYDPVTAQSKSSGLSTDFGYVEFDRVEQAAHALQKKSHDLNGFRLKVQQVKRTREVLVGVSKKKIKQLTGEEQKANPHPPSRHVSYSHETNSWMTARPHRVTTSPDYSLTYTRDGGKKIYAQTSAENLQPYNIFYQHLKRLDVRGTATATSYNWTNYGLQQETRPDYINRIERIGFFSNRISVSKWKV